MRQMTKGPSPACGLTFKVGLRLNELRGLEDPRARGVKIHCFLLGGLVYL